MKARSPVRMKRKYEVDEGHPLVIRGRIIIKEALFDLRRALLTLKWRRVPKVWELRFIDKMRGLERRGLPFGDVLKATLPQLFGDDTSLVLRTWVGRKGRKNPEGFARAVSGMFGKSARNVLTSVERISSQENLLSAGLPEAPSYTSLVEAIQKADESAAILQEMRTGATALVLYDPARSQTFNTNFS